MGDNLISIEQIHFILTERCQLHCRHCALSNSSKVKKEAEISKQQVIDILRLASDKGLTRVVLSGGEPFVRDDLVSILYEVSQLGFSICAIGTNALDIPFSIIVELAALRTDFPALQIRISLDGASPQTHDWIRGENSFSRTMKTIDRLDSQNIPISGINTVITKQNLHEIGRLVAIAEKLNAQDLTLIDMIPIGRAVDLEDISLNVEEWQSIYTFRQENYKHLNTVINIRGPLQRSFLPLLHLEASPIRLDTIYVGANGHMFLCYPFQSHSVESVQMNFPEQSWLNTMKLYQSITQRCPNCEMRVLCHGLTEIPS